MRVVATMVLSVLVLSGCNKASHPVLQKSSSSFRYTLFVCNKLIQQRSDFSFEYRYGFSGSLHVHTSLFHAQILPSGKIKYLNSVLEQLPSSNEYRHYWMRCLVQGKQLSQWWCAASKFLQRALSQ